MLQLVLGIAGTGKTTVLLDAADARAAEGRPSILLVPEQFSAAAEAMAWRRLGDAKSALVEVLSFRTLAERVLRAAGGLQLPVLAEADRAVFVRRALDAVGDKLSAFARQRRSAAFCNLCAHTLAELKTAGATPALVRSIAQNGDDDKLLELALIFEAYEAAIAGAAMDPEDRLTLAAARTGGYFEGKAVFVDSFDGFTAPEYGLLARLLAECERLHVALCCPNLNETGGPGVFTPVRRVAHKLKTMAEKAGVAAEAVLLDPLPKRPQTPALAAVNELLAYGEAPPPEDSAAPSGRGPGEAEDSAPAPALTLTAFENEWEEVRAAAAEMHRLALAGVPYGKMALVCRDVAAYERVVRRQLALYGIPVFADFARTIEYTAPVAFLRAALGLLRGGLTAAGLLALLKTGLCGFGEGEIAAFENYVFTWDPKAAALRAPFEKNPDGLLAALDAAAEAQLAAAEKLRAAAVPAVEAFLQKARGATARALCKNLYLLLDRFGAPEHLQAQAEAFTAAGEADYGDQLRRAWDLAMQMLDKLAVLLGDERVSADEFDELLLILVRSTDFGQAPQTLECVLFSGADRMRLAEPDHCFVLGLCEGEFPMQVGYSGLLTHNDRDTLVAGGVEMPGSFENRTLLEEMFFYRALCAPRKGLHLSWPRRRAGAAKSLSAAVEPIIEALAPPPLAPNAATLAATPAAAYDLLCGCYRDDSPLAATLYGALEAQPAEVAEDTDAASGGTQGPRLAGAQANWPRALALLWEVDNPGLFSLSRPGAVRALVGKSLTLSATVAQQYFDCRFSYFMERVLRVRPRRRAELSPMESGTFVHHILEKVLAEAGAGFACCTSEALEEMANRHADAFIAEFLPADTRRAAWQLGQIKATTVRLLRYMRDAAANSDFAMDAVELTIGAGGVAPLTVRCADGTTVQVTGQIDRVDVLRRDENTYLCIVDYKTGDKKLDLKEVYNGLNMQMMIYMEALAENAADRYPNPIPAGVLYLGSDPAPTAGSRQGAEGEGFAMAGLLLSDPAILQAMDRSGRVLGVRYKKDGTPYAGKNMADPAKWQAIGGHVRALLGQMAAGVQSGDFAARPAVSNSHNPCAWCAYRAACRHEEGRHERPIEAPPGVFEPAPPADAPEGGEAP